jgi:hypothetical protein
MKIEWGTVISVLIAMVVFKMLDRLILDGITEKVASNFETEDEE